MSENRLANETSPYLLQHADNPVHWWPWGDDALKEASKTGKPILLSIGYAACHWCHVMAHESFEDEETAKLMNELFVNIKVDREERPDIDTIYMSALHALGEQGGWPLTMFLTPDAKPFWGGTYFPKTSLYGRPSFTAVLKEISRVHSEETHKISSSTHAIAEHLARKPIAPQQIDLSEPFLCGLGEKLLQVIDPAHGGIQGAPKFPQVSFFDFLWRTALKSNQSSARKAVEQTLTHICQGGIFDHLGGGFARYTVDEKWLVPHFEKMLYDNAQILELMTELWRETKNPLFETRAEETVSWLFREMIGEGEAFASSLDADSEGEEGKFYVWTKQEILDVLGEEDGSWFAEIYDVTDKGNFEGKSILNRLHNLDLLSDEEEDRLKSLRQKLMDVRETRIRPGWDDKILADWNSLMIASLAKAGQAFSKPDWIKAAQKAFSFMTTSLAPDGRLHHSYRKTKLGATGVATDYANMIAAALSLYQVTGEQSYLDKALELYAVFDTHFWDKEDGGYFFTADDVSDVIIRTKSASDDATPNANGTMISNLTALFLLTGNTVYRDKAGAILSAFSGAIAQNLVAHTGLLASTFDHLAPVHIVIVSPDEDADIEPLLHELNQISLPGAVIQKVDNLALISDKSPAHNKIAIDGKPTAYICIGPQCSAPITQAEELADTLRSQRQSLTTGPS